MPEAFYDISRLDAIVVVYGGRGARLKRHEAVKLKRRGSDLRTNLVALRPTVLLAAS